MTCGDLLQCARKLANSIKRAGAAAVFLWERSSAGLALNPAKVHLVQQRRRFDHFCRFCGFAFQNGDAGVSD
jgi:hypothetical protein